MKLRNIFSDQFTGHSEAPDTIRDDPQADRVRTFRAVLKGHIFSLVPLNLLYLIAWIPVIIWTLMNASVLTAIPENTTFSGVLILYIMIFYPLTVLIGPSNMGISMVMWDRARGEHTYTVWDFLKGIRTGWKQGLLLSLLNAAVLLFSSIALLYYIRTGVGTIISYIPAAFILILALFWDLSIMLMPTMLISCDRKFRIQLKNAFLITFAELPRAALVRLATLCLPICGITAAFVFPNSAIVITGIIGILYLFFIPAFNKLLIAYYSTMICEKYLNYELKISTQTPDFAPDIAIRERKNNDH